MCGIAGLVRPDVDLDADRRTISRMLDRIVHRGPDDEGTHQSGVATIGMRRLSIIDLSGGHQPIANEDANVWVVCNGEIYNFKHLRRELESNGHRFACASDTEVIVHAYEQWGDAFLDRIDGMYGLALWDMRKNRLLLARDRLGIKPLYYTVAGRRLAFASEIKALLEVPWVSASLDETALIDHLTLGYAVPPNTLFDGIKKLAPGERLVWHNGTVQRDVYWQLPTTVDDRLTEAEAIERIRAELERATRDHMVADVPVGAFLSGGVDSSTLVALMGKELATPVNTYAIGYGGSAVADYYNELPYARQVAERYRTNHREILVSPNVAELLPRLMWHLEEPICDTAIFTTYLVSELAARSVKVIMSGVGGDELFAGYTRYLGDHYATSYRRLPAWLRGRVIEPVAELLPSGRSTRLRDLARYAKQFVRAGRLDWQHQYKSFIRLEHHEVLSALLRSSAHMQPDGYDRVVNDVVAHDPMLRLFTVDARTQLAESLLLLSDKMTMATSIECRVPFLDRGLVEAAATVPHGIKARRGRLKYLLKRVVADVLPHDVITRRKRGFGAPMGAWLQNELRPLRAELLSDRGLAARGLFDGTALKRICAQHDAHAEDYSDLLMVLMNLEIWCRIFLDRASHADVSESLVVAPKAA